MDNEHLCPSLEIWEGFFQEITPKGRAEPTQAETGVDDQGRETSTCKGPVQSKTKLARLGSSAQGDTQSTPRTTSGHPRTATHSG